MLETGLGRATNLALAALPGFTLPGDTSASRYFTEDLTEPFVLAPDGTMPVPDGPGIGVEPLAETKLRAHRPPRAPHAPASCKRTIRGLGVPRVPADTTLEQP